MKLTEYVRRLGSFKTNPRGHGRPYKTATQLAILARLRDGPADPATIADEMGLPAQTVRVTMSRLKKHGFITYHAPPVGYIRPEHQRRGPIPRIWEIVE